MKPRPKMRIPRRGMTYRDDADFDTMWGILASAIREIHTKNASKLSFEELYRNAYKTVLKKQGIDLYNKVIDFERNMLSKEVLESIKTTITPLLGGGMETTGAMDQANERRVAGDRFLSKMKEVWEDYQLCMGMITDVLMYMDKAVSAEHRKPSIYVSAMGTFRDYILRSLIDADYDATVNSVLESTILFMIQLEREGIIIDRPLIRHCIYMLEGLYETLKEEETEKLYLTTFEPSFLSSSRDYYLAEGQRLLETTDASTFCKRVSARINEEEARCRHTISSLTEQKIMDVVDECLIKRNIGEVIKLEGSGVKYMLDNDRLDDLTTVYDLISRIDDKKEALTSAVQARIIELGDQINKAAKEFAQAPRPSLDTNKTKATKSSDDKTTASLQTSAAIKWVDDILELKRRFDHFLKDAFKEDHGMQSALTSSFSDFINSNPRSAEFLSLFFDENLKKGIKGKSEEEVDSVLDNGITLLRYIRDKDLFETYYKKHLSRRLLMKRSVSMDVERQMISKMKMEVGNTFTQRLEAMFKDMTVSEDLTSSYGEYVSQRGEPDPKRIDLQMSVLTSAMWPMEIMGKDGPQTQCIYPKKVDGLKQSFETFYLGKHSGRKLSWQGGMGTADIRATWVRPSGKMERHELNVSTYAMVILLLFNDLPAGESLTFEEIQARTNIPASDLTRNLQSLAVAPKTRVLKKEPMSRAINSDDKFFFNEEFQSKFTKIKIGVVSSGGNKVENKDERHETEEKVKKDREGFIEAALVRIMKQRKELSHTQLISDAISQISPRFSPEISMVKERIEALIDREYFERITGSEPPAYSYVA